MNDIVRSHLEAVTNRPMIEPEYISPPVALKAPEAQELCEASFFALMLSSLRRRFPRVHYTFPQFATFCRGEILKEKALLDLQEELEEILQGLAELDHTDLFMLRDGENADALEIYQQAHYRGRTFDRNRISAGTNEPARTPWEVYSPLLNKILDAARKAASTHAELAQEKRAYHTPPRAV